jgi:uncharacterized membrane protein HdeD (DUF308 family)
MGRDQGYPRWALSVVGCTLAVLGALAVANLIVGGAPPVRFISSMMALGAVAQLLHALLMVGWSGFYGWLLIGALYGAAGLVVFYDPSLASMTSAVSAVLALAASAILRIRMGLRLQPPVGWRWLALSGAFTLAVGVVVAMGWPVDHAGLFGMVLAADLLVQGIMAVAFGFSLKRDR